MERIDWDKIYRNTPIEKIPWHTSKPDKILIKLVNEGKIKKGKVMDLCSGDGTNSIWLASKGFDVSGVDISPTAVEIAKKRCEEAGVECDYKVGDVLNFESNDKYNFILDRGCFHHIPKEKKEKYILRLVKLLKREGKFLLHCFSDRNIVWGKALSKEDIKNYFSKYFDIKFIKESVHIEPDSKDKVYLYSVFMEMNL